MSEKDGQSKKFLSVNERFADAFNFRESDREAFSKFVPNYWVNLIVSREIRDFNKFSSVGNDVVNLLNTFTGLKLKANTKGDRTDMCKGVEDWTNHTKAEERIRINKLNSILLDAERYDDLKRSATDEQFQEELLKELVPEIK